MTLSKSLLEHYRAMSLNPPGNLPVHVRNAFIKVMGLFVKPSSNLIEEHNNLVLKGPYLKVERAFEILREGLLNASSDCRVIQQEQLPPEEVQSMEKTDRKPKSHKDKQLPQTPPSGPISKPQLLPKGSQSTEDSPFVNVDLEAQKDYKMAASRPSEEGARRTTTNTISIGSSVPKPGTNVADGNSTYPEGTGTTVPGADVNLPNNSKLTTGEKEFEVLSANNFKVDTSNSSANIQQNMTSPQRLGRSILLQRLLKMIPPRTNMILQKQFKIKIMRNMNEMNMSK